MAHKLDYKKVFRVLVSKTCDYLVDNNIACMVLGISGGIDSTLVAAICNEVTLKTGIPLIGRSLPIKNEESEISTADLVGKAFCNDYKVRNLWDSYFISLLNITNESKYGEYKFLSNLENHINRTPIANGNVQARLRMIYLYDLASIHKGLVMSTDNQTEYQLGFWTLHGDVGDFNPIQGLWKTEVYELSNWLMGEYLNTNQTNKYIAIKQSISLTPTDGLGISNSDLDQIGANSYEEVDSILQEFEYYQSIMEFPKQESLKSKSKKFLQDQLLDIDKTIITSVLSRHIASEFKRKQLPIYIDREEYV